MKTNLLLFFLALNFFACQSQSILKENMVNKYSLKFGSLNDRSITVEASIYVEGDEIEMMSRPIRFIPDINSWWDIITVEKLEDIKGNVIKILKTSGNKAILDRRITGILKINYTVDISYVDRNYPNLNTAIGKSFKEGLFIVGKPLFIFGNWKLNTIVKIEKPQGVKITVPWKKGRNNYKAVSLRELILSNVIVSTNSIGVVDFSVGKLSYSLATFGLDKESVAMVKQIANDISKYYVNTFPLNKEIRYVQLVYGVPGRNGGGEAYPNSSASAISSNNMKTSFFWKITVFHELFHMWNSHMIKGVAGNETMEWFQEGFTDYMTEMALLKNNHIDAQILAKYQKNSLKPLQQRFENNPNKITIKNSGSNKGQNYVIVYRGGWFIANWLEKRFEKLSNKTWSIQRLFQHILEKFPLNGQQDLTVEAFLDVIAEIDKKTSQDLKIILNTIDWQTLKKYEK